MYHGVFFKIKLQAQARNFIEKETLAQVFSCDFCESFKNTNFYSKPLVAVHLFTLVKNNL